MKNKTKAVSERKALDLYVVEETFCWLLAFSSIMDY